jgi:hypothetical protein
VLSQICACFETVPGLETEQLSILQKGNTFIRSVYLGLSSQVRLKIRGI